MNTIFLAKMLQAKKLEYEAVRELLPESAKISLDTFTGNLTSTFREIALQLMNLEREQSENSRQGGGHNGQGARKVPIDFE